MVKPSFQDFEFLTADDLNAGFADCVSLSATGTQTLASILNGPEIIATIGMQTAQMVVTGDLVCTSASAITVPVGPTIERPNVPTFGMLRANSDAGTFECLLASGKWATIVTTSAAVTPVNQPIAISSPSFGVATSTAIPVGWTTPTGGTPPFTYSVQFRLAGTSLWTTWVQQTTTLSTTVSGLFPAARYEFTVSALNDAGSVTSPVIATNTLGFLPGGPSNLTASLGTSTTLALTWLPVNGIVAYQVQYALRGASSWTDFDGPLVNSNTTVTGLVPNTTYVMRVLAKTLGSTMESLAVQGSTTAAATSAPNAATGLVTSGVNASGFTVSWQPPGAGTQPMSYDVQYQLVGTSTWTTYTTTTQLSATLTNLDTSAGYNVRIASTNSAGTSTSTPISITISSATAATGSTAGTQNSGPTYPQIIAPASAAIIQGAALTITGITVVDPAAIYSPGTLALTVTCSGGHVTMTDQTGSQILGSGTASISYASTFSSIASALSSLVYTSTTTGSDNIAIKLTDQLIQQSALAIPVLVVAGSGGTGTTPPPGGTTSPNLTSSGQPTDLNGTLAQRSASFVDSVGINVRLEDIGYNRNYSLAQAAVIENMVNYLGSGHIRTLRESSGINVNPSFLAQIAQNCGQARFVLYIAEGTPASSYFDVLSLMQQTATNFPAFVAALEGVYGADNFATSAASALAPAAQFQSGLYAEAHSIGLPAWQLAPVTPANNTLFGHPPADAANTSVYPPFSPNGSGAPFFTTDTNGYLSDAMSSASTTTPNLPIIVSNFGWQSFPDGLVSTGLGLVSETTQAAYVLETLFSAFQQGAAYFIVNELMDVPPSASIVDVGQTFGLFNVSGTPKVAAAALRNTLLSLVDLDSTARSFSAGKLNYTIQNKPATYAGFIHTGYQDVVLQTSSKSGVYYIIMWNEQVLNTLGGNNVPISVPVTNIELVFNENAKSSVVVYDPISNIVLTRGNAVTAIGIALPAHPIIVQVTF